MVHDILDRCAALGALGQHPIQQAQTLIGRTNAGKNEGTRNSLHRVIERNLSVQDRIEQNTQGPNFSSFSTILFAFQDLG